MGRVFGKYLLLEMPGWAIAGGALFALVEWWELSPRLAFLLFGIWVVKDLLLFPVLRIAYEPGPADPSNAMIGRSGVARGALDPVGYVQVGSELWRAELAPGCGPVARGDRVRVESVDRLTLRVVLAEEPAPGLEPGEVTGPEASRS